MSERPVINKIMRKAAMMAVRGKKVGACDGCGRPMPPELKKCRACRAKERVA